MWDPALAGLGLVRLKADPTSERLKRGYVQTKIEGGRVLEGSSMPAFAREGVELLREALKFDGGALNF